MQLNQKKCLPCEGGTLPLKKQEIKQYMPFLKPGWKVNNDHAIVKTFPTKNMMAGVEFARRVAELADEEGHHPDIHIHIRSVEIELTTHAINGLSENDFILAAKIDAL